MTDETRSSRFLNRLADGLTKLGEGVDYVKLIRENAEAAWESGSRVYIPRLPLPNVGSGNVQRWADQVEAIEDVGWVMDFWAVSSNDAGDSADSFTPIALPLFRRPVEAD